MSTRSMICCYRPEFDNYVGVYCHNDGYPEYVGMILYTFYNTQEKVMELMKLGDLSSIGAKIGVQFDMEKGFSDSKYRKKYEGQCSAYHRDRGEEFNCSRFKTEEDIIKESGFDINYFYVFKNGTWKVSKGSKFNNLRSVLRSRAKGPNFATYGIEKSLSKGEREVLMEAYQSIGFKPDFELDPKDDLTIYMVNAKEFNSIENMYVKAKTPKQALNQAIERAYHGKELERFKRDFAIVSIERYGIYNATVWDRDEFVDGFTYFLIKPRNAKLIRKDE